MSTTPIKLVADTAGFQDNMRAAAQATRELMLSEKDLATALAVARGASEEKERMLKALGVSSREYADAQRLLKTRTLDNTAAFKDNKASMKDAVEMLENASGVTTGLGSVIRQAATPALLGMAVAAVAIGQATEWWISGEAKLQSLVQSTNNDILGKAAALEKARDRGAKLSEAQERIIENAGRIQAQKMADEWREQTKAIIDTEMRLSMMEGTLSVLDMAGRAVGFSLKIMGAALFGVIEGIERFAGHKEMADRIHGWRVAFEENLNVAARAADLLREKIQRTRDAQQALMAGIALSGSGGSVPEAPRPTGKPKPGASASDKDSEVKKYIKTQADITAALRDGEARRSAIRKVYADVESMVRDAGVKAEQRVWDIKFRNSSTFRRREFNAQRKADRDLLKLHGATQAEIREYDRETARIKAELLAASVANFNSKTQESIGYAQQAFGKNKGLAIASAVMNTAQGATKAYADWGWPMGLIAAGIVVAAGLKQIQDIRGAKGEGQAHSGNDNTRSGTYNLTAGEMVLDPLAGSTGRALVDLARKGADQPRNRGGKSIVLNISGNVYGGRAGVKQLAKAVRSASAYGVR